MTYFMLSGCIISACLTLENNYPCDTMIFCYHQVMAWGKVMACLDRQGVANYVSQLDKANLLLKWPKSMLYLFFLQYNIWIPFSQHLHEMEASAKCSFQFSVFKFARQKLANTLDDRCPPLQDMTGHNKNSKNRFLHVIV